MREGSDRFYLFDSIYLEIIFTFYIYFSVLFMGLFFCFVGSFLRLFSDCLMQ